MNVYVVSNVWAREGSPIVGAAADLVTAESIADRVGAYRWSAWAEVGGTMERTAMLADGTEWPKLRQEIVCVPLAGTPTLAAGDQVRFTTHGELGRQVIDDIRGFTTPRD